MKYTVTAYTDSEKEYSTIVHVRSDAKLETVFKSCINMIAWKLIDENEIPENAKYGFELPNIWINGYCGTAWIEKPFCNITIQEETGAWLAL